MAAVISPCSRSNGAVTRTIAPVAAEIMTLRPLMTEMTTPW